MTQMTHTQIIRPALCALLAALVVPAAAARAQQLVEAPSVRAEVTTPAAPAATSFGPVNTPTGIARADAVRSAEPLNFHRQRLNRDERWMVVGGALLVVGSVMDGEAGEILVISGAIIGIIGLVRYIE
jgi:hypothetical protein